MIHGLVSGTISGSVKIADKYTAGRINVKVDRDTITVGWIAFAADVRAMLDGLQNGDAVSLSGDLIPKTFVDRSGANRATVNITVTKVLVA